MRHGKRKQHVYVIRSAPNHVRVSGNGLNDAPYVLEHAWQMFFTYGNSRTFCMEDDMEINIGISVCHAEPMNHAIMLSNAWQDEKSPVLVKAHGSLRPATHSRCSGFRSLFFMVPRADALG